MDATDPKLKLHALLRSLPPATPEVRREQRLTLAVNGALLPLALWQGWGLAALIWPYWIQSVAIGAFNAHRMSRLTRFSTTGLESNGKPVSETAAGRNGATAFFCAHYGLFHLVYVVFLATMASPAAGEWRWIVVGGLAFALAQTFTHRRQVSEDAHATPNLGQMMFLPYLRILPIHFTIILAMPLMGTGFGGSLVVLVFGGLKAGADHWSIRAEDAVARAARDAPATPAVAEVQ